jgi:hypothetical protein
VQKDCDSQHLSCQTNVKSAIYCEKCVILENQLHIVQEELKSAKSIINLLLKDLELKEANSDKCVSETTSEQTHTKSSAWSDVIKGVRKSDTCTRQIDMNSIQVVLN